MTDNQEISEQFLNSIKTIDNIPCFVKINDSKFLVVAIHQHQGLVQSFAEMTSLFVQNSASLIIPDLFCNVQIQNTDEDNEFSYLKQINFSDVYLILKKCISYAKNKNKTIILLGFSTGAALGFKSLELLDDISLGVFFYGYPIAKNLQPEKVDCPVIIFHSEKDKIKHLSDDEQLNSIIQVFANRPLVQFQRITSHHGFMNPSHQNYDKKSFNYCRKMFQQYLSEFHKGQKKIGKEEKSNQKDQKQEQGGCRTF